MNSEHSKPSQSSDPSIIVTLRGAGERSDADFGTTVVVPPDTHGVWQALRIRPELLSENQSGDRVYRVSPKQARKAVAIWDSDFADEYAARRTP